MPDLIQRQLDRADEVYQLARDLVGTKSVLFLGRHAGFPVALLVGSGLITLGCDIPDKPQR